MDYKIVLGYVAVAIGFAGYVPYFKDIFINITKPHAFSWLVWGLLNSVAFAIQWTEGGGAGAWVTGMTAVVCIAITVLALLKGDRAFTKADWGFLGAALSATLLWIVTDDPTLSVVLIGIIDTIGFGPSVIKGYHKPHEETALTFALASLTFGLSLLALESYAVATWFFPATLMTVNGSFTAMLLIRRRQVSSPASP